MVYGGWGVVLAWGGSDIMYTKLMNHFFNNRFVQIGGLALGFTFLAYLFLWIVFSLIKIQIDSGLMIVISLLTSIWLVWKFYAWRIG